MNEDEQTIQDLIDICQVVSDVGYFSDGYVAPDSRLTKDNIPANVDSLVHKVQLETAIEMVLQMLEKY